MKKSKIISVLFSGGGIHLSGADSSRSRAISDLSEAVPAIREFIGKTPADNVQLIFCVPRHLLAARFLELPALDPGDIKKMAAYQAAESFPFSPDELTIDAVPLRSDVPGGLSTVFLAAIQNKNLDPFLHLLDQINIYPNAFVSSVFALSSYLDKEGVAFENYLHLHREDGWIEIDAFIGKNLVASRAVAWRAENSIDLLAAECRTSLQSFRGDDPAQCVVLSGMDQSRAAEIRPALEREFGIPVRVLEESEGSHPVTVGALSVPGRMRMDLLPWVHKEKRAALSRKKALRSAGIWAALWLAAFGTAFGSRIAARAVEIAKLDQQIKNLEPDARESRDLLKRLESLNGKAGAGGAPLDVLRAFHVLAPEGITLTALSGLENGRVVLQGNANRYADVMDMIARSERSPLFSQVELKTSSSREVQGKKFVDFQIQCRMEGAGKG